jgi:NAD(P)-dependent dehydrogenase (short-subunit alcohol dehydrogenase family)
MSTPAAGPPAGDAARLLRRGLLEGIAVAVAGASSPQEAPGAAAEAQPLGRAARVALGELGARTFALQAMRSAEALEEGELDGAVTGLLSEDGHLDALVVDAASLFAAAGAGRDGLGVCLQAAWNVTRAVASAAFIGDGRDGGRVIYIAPPADAGEHADAVRAGLENLCRTLSIEWARHAITTVTVAPGQTTSADEVGALVCYVCSPAGAYFSGCLLDLRGVQ